MFKNQEALRRRNLVSVGRHRTLARHHCLTVARRTPRKRKSAPAVRLSHCAAVSFARKRSLKAEANHARLKHQIVPVVTNVRPRKRNARTFVPDAGSMNCGRKARKKSATFGFRILVNTPCRNAAADVARIAESPSAAAQVWKILPREIPSADAIPASRPCAMVRPKM